ncbi:MAG TPA: S49 family peptidase [Prolixibacteraceae bacterium]|nr:S49 family peptidase [Prolixibacteraceae bacterium]
MNNIFLQVMRERMMVDRQLVESVYLPWLAGAMNGNMSLGPNGTTGKKAFAASAHSFTKEAFAMSGRSASMAMMDATAGSVAVVPIFGEFLKYGSQCTYGANEIVPAIYQAGDMKNIVALVLDVDSGGGAESAVPPFIEAIKYVQSKGKPVVLHGDMVASAAYYIGSFCDYLMADNLISSAFGSIGVYVSYMDYKEQLEKKGIKHKTIYAPQSDLKNHEYRELVDNDNSEPLINNILIPSATRFINTVKQNRKGKISEESDVYRGKLYEGEDIVKEGLADGFGTLYDALEVASGMAMMRRG